MRINDQFTMTTEYHAKLQFDGGSRGNPGISGAGAVLYHDDREIWSGSFFVGENETNNYAEYAGLIAGLQQAVDLHITHLLVEGDSLLVVNQLRGLYKCRSPNLIEMYAQAKQLETHFASVSYAHVLRRRNKRADELANNAMDQYVKDMSLICP